MQCSRLFQVLLLTFLSQTDCMEYGLKWGEVCKIPGPNDYLKPSEECEMSKGLHCQVYQQGILCGCLIRSSLSWDEPAGECRRKPGHHCPYINTTTDSRAYDSLPYNHKCHKNAECVQIDPIPEVEATKSKKTRKQPEQFAVCKCKPGYKERRDMLVCQDVNSTHRISYGSLLTAATLLLLSLVT